MIEGHAALRAFKPRRKSPAHPLPEKASSVLRRDVATLIGPGSGRSGDASGGAGGFARIFPAHLACVLAFVCAFGCVPKKGALSPAEGQEKALWAAFIAPAAEKEKAFSLSASLNLQSPQKSARLLAKFWGNLERPLRLDLSTGLGQTFSLWREDELGWIAVYPLSNQAFTHADTKSGLSRLGMPFPFGLKDLAAIAAGRYGLILPAHYRSVKKTAKGFEYLLAPPSAVASVTLDFEGKPIHLTGRGVEPWSVDLGDFAPLESGRGLAAQKIELTTPGGVKALLRVKKLELQPGPMDSKTLDLALPPGARHIPLDRPGEFRIPDIP
jgi:hypothetical protein